jgi:penicillin-binding protein 2
MTAQIANGGYKITPKILTDDNQLTSEQVKKAMQDSKLNNNRMNRYIMTKEILRLFKRQCSVQQMS